MCCNYRAARMISALTLWQEVCGSDYGQIFRADDVNYIAVGMGFQARNAMTKIGAQPGVLGWNLIGGRRPEEVQKTHLPRMERYRFTEYGKAYYRQWSQGRSGSGHP